VNIWIVKISSNIIVVFQFFNDIDTAGSATDVKKEFRHKITRRRKRSPPLGVIAIRGGWGGDEIKN
jgi:hypothetical protein